MKLKLKIDAYEYPVLGFSLSIILHAVIITVIILLLNTSLENRKIGSPYVQIRTIEALPDISRQESKPKHEETDQTTKEVKVKKEETPVKENNPETETGVRFYNFSETVADTNSLVQVYSEKTLNVLLKYPAGWTYIDQDVKNKLDGVTFWTTSEKYNPPPYVHVEVKDKDIFNSNRFQHSYKTRNYTAYYNDPEELAGQFTQIIYIRTDTNEDYSLKLIMKGEEAFKSFQPVFFGMVKSFKYGTRLF
jgi:hypothetical protein